MTKEAKPHIICIEGVKELERAKIARRLAFLLDIPFVELKTIKLGSHKKRIFEELAYVFNQTILQFRDYSFVTERSPLNSRIMSEVYVRKSRLEYITELCLKLNPLIVYITTSHQSRLMTKENASDALRRFKGYKNYLSNQQLYNLIEVDIERLNYQKAATKIKQKIEDKIELKNRF